MALLVSAVLELLKVEKPTLHSWPRSSWVVWVEVIPPPSVTQSAEHRALSRLGPAGRRVFTAAALRRVKPWAVSSPVLPHYLASC